MTGGPQAAGMDATAGEPAARRPVFISYAVEEADVARRLRAQLEGTGFPCFLPSRPADTADARASAMQAVDASSCLVVILSNRSNQDASVRNEVEAAYRQGKPIFPFRVEQTLPSPQLELFISAKHWIDAWQGTIEAHAARLALELSGEPTVHGPLSSLPWYRQRRWQHAGLALSVATAAAVAINALLPAKHLDDVPEDSYSASLSFTGGYIVPGKRNEVTYSIKDAYSRDSFSPIGALAHMQALEFYDITVPVGALLIDKADVSRFSGQFGNSLGNKLSFAGLPMLLVSCLAYRRPDTSTYETVLEAHGFAASSTLYGHASFSRFFAGKKRVLSARTPTTCASILQPYIAEAVDRPEFEGRARAAAKARAPSPSAPPAVVAPKPGPPEPLSERENIVGTLVMSGAFNKSFCRAAAFSVAPNAAGVAAFKQKHGVTDAEVQTTTALWAAKYKALDERILPTSCASMLENYIGHELVVRTSSAPLTPPRTAVVPRE